MDKVFDPELGMGTVEFGKGLEDNNPTVEDTPNLCWQAAVVNKQKNAVGVVTDYAGLTHQCLYLCCHYLCSY